ncbi:MAG: glycosyltransferase family 2 protein [Eubacteriales bacterium]
MEQFKGAILTICIPTYNMGQELVETLKKIVLSQDNRFRIIVLDNKSTDESYSCINTIKNEKLKIIQNNINIGATGNYLKCLSLSDTEYCLLLLDKDIIEIDRISSFINFLIDQKPAYGYIRLNSTKSKLVFSKYRSGGQAIRKLSYLGKHPTGYFYKTTLFCESANDSDYLRLNPSFPFPFEILNSYIGERFDGFIVDYNLLDMRPRELNKKKSASYNKSNLYFYPVELYKQFRAYLLNLNTLRISQFQKNVISTFIVAKFMQQVSFLYRENMKDEYVCNHYYIQPKKVTNKEMMLNIRDLFDLYKRVLDEIDSLKLFYYINLIIAVLLFIENFFLDKIRKFLELIK